MESYIVENGKIRYGWGFQKAKISYAWYFNLFKMVKLGTPGVLYC